MKRIALIGFIAVVVMLMAALPSEAFHRHRGAEVDVFLGVGPSWYAYPRPYYVYPAPPVVYAPSVVVVPQPVYTVPPPPPAYWYYCPSFGNYYPRVPSCPEPWVPVPTR